jgi:long-subunit fatty acid transport protein
MSLKLINTLISKILYLMGVFLICFQTAFSQSLETIEISDLETWNSIQVGYKLNKNWSFDFEEQLRLKNNSSEIGSYFSELSTTYKLPSDIKLAAGFRYSRENDTKGAKQGYREQFRYQVDVSYQHKLSKLELSYRIRYQNKREFSFTESLNKDAIQKMRFKVGLNYNIPKWKFDPNISLELFNQISGTNTGFDAFRFTSGTDYKLNKHNKIGLYYRLERELNKVYPKSTHIIGIEYKYSF